VAGAFVAVASDFGGFAAALNLKTTVEPRIDRMDPDAKPMGAANDYP
jgi:shikimate 5-dehydrogenase